MPDIGFIIGPPPMHVPVVNVFEKKVVSKKNAISDLFEKGEPFPMKKAVLLENQRKMPFYFEFFQKKDTFMQTMDKFHYFQKHD